MITKRVIVQLVIKQLGRELENLAGASRTMHADASDEQNKAEDQYDTRGLETAYLASSQARLATETEAAMAAYQTLTLRKFAPADSIDLAALVELESRGARDLYFIGPKRGGMEVQHKGTEVIVITSESPLGQQLVGKKAGERVKLQTRGPAQEFRIISVR